MPYRPQKPVISDQSGGSHQSGTRPPVTAPLTGIDLVRQAGLQCAIGDRPGYLWQSGVIVLPRDIALGTDILSLIIAAEEVAHARQPHWWHVLRFIPMVRWLEEADAFLRVKLWLRGRG